MLISKSWLKKYIPDIQNISDTKLADKVTSSIAEVESITHVGEGLEKLVAGRVIKVEKHPNADKLNVCQVDVGFDKPQIVCGAPNVKEGMHVIVCLPGGKVYSPKEQGEMVEIKQVKIRDVESNGMICSERELGISEEHTGIMALPETYKPGEEIDDILKDTIFEIENKSLTHRGDCFSHLGLAREIAAIFDLNFNRANPVLDPVQTESLPIEINIESKKLNRFTAITVKNVKVEQSPFWLKNVLRNIGVRSVNNIVDVSNYILHDLGQPVHIYDYREVNGNKLIVREARSGESFTAIDNQKYTLSEGDIVISDNKEIQGLGGIIGGKKSEVTEKTVDIIIEAAIFDSKQILKTSRSQGINTDATTRFSKGVDPDMTLEALKNTVSIVADLAQGEIASEVLDINLEEEEKRTIRFDMQEIKRLSGITIETSEALSYLERLQLVIENRQSINTSESILTAPRIVEVGIPRRRKDLQEPVDLVEEVVRIHGYDRVTPVMPMGELKARPINPVAQANRTLRHLMMKYGFEETLNYSFISEETKEKLGMREKNLIKITNAISPELKYVRNTMAPSLVETYIKNYKLQPNLRLFEIGRIADKAKYTEEKLPHQPWRLGVIIGNKDGKSIELKGIMTSLLEGYGLNPHKILWRDYLPSDNPYVENMAHPFRKSTATYGDYALGSIMEISPVIANKIVDDNLRLTFAEFDIDNLREVRQNENLYKFKEISKFQSLSRDVSFWVQEDNAIGNLYRLIRKNMRAKSKDIDSSVEIIDQYSKDGEKSITLRIHIQPLTQNLTREQINTMVSEVVEQIAKSAGVKVRE